MSNAAGRAWTTIASASTLLLDPHPDAAAVMASQLCHTSFETNVTCNGLRRLARESNHPLGAIVVVADLTRTAIRNDPRRVASESCFVRISKSMTDPAVTLLGSDALFAARVTAASRNQRLNTLSNVTRSTS